MLDRLLLSLAALAACSLPALAGVPDDDGPFCCCRKFEVGRGPEDFEVDAPRHRLLVSSVERKAGAEQAPGAILAVPIGNDGSLGKAHELKLEGRDGALFHPVGISLVRTAEASTLYVAVRNVRPGQHAVERFRVEEGTLHFEQRLTSDLLISPNDLLALDDGQIYVSNDSGSRSRLGILFERLTRRPWSSVIHFDGQGHGRTAADGIVFANGLALDARTQELFVAAFQEGRILVFQRDPATGGLTRQRDIRLAGAPDNLVWKDEDHLLVAAHGSVLKTGLHQSFGLRRAPSRIYEVSVRQGETGPKLLLRSSGDLISASSTAAILDSRLYVGQLVNGWITVCEPEASPAPASLSR